MAVVTLDTVTGDASLRYMSDAVGDFPTIHPLKTGQKTRWGGAFVLWGGVRGGGCWLGLTVGCHSQPANPAPTLSNR